MHPVTLKAAIFATDEKFTFLNMKLLEDNIYNLLGTAEDYILKNICWRSEIIDTERTEIPEIPVAIIREVLANSFAHAVYNGRTYADKIFKTVRTVQRALDSLRDKGYIQRVGSKQEPKWEILK